MASSTWASAEALSRPNPRSAVLPRRTFFITFNLLIRLLSRPENVTGATLRTERRQRRTRPDINQRTEAATTKKGQEKTNPQSKRAEENTDEGQALMRK